MADDGPATGHGHGHRDHHEHDHRERTPVDDLASPGELRAALAALPIDPPPETVPLREARDRVLAERVDAVLDVPGFDRTTMDGYAVRAADLAGASDDAPRTLSVVGTVPAGCEPGVAVDPGTAVRIETGAVVPEGADAVVPLEATSEYRDGADDPGPASGGDEDAVAIYDSVAAGDAIMPAGTDVAAGERALGPGTVLSHREVGLLAALGVDPVPVVARPTVGVLPTGAELVPPGDGLEHGAGQIHDVNSDALAAAVGEAGGDARVLERVADDRGRVERVLADAAETCDLLLTAGASSAGGTDLLPDVVAAHGRIDVHGVAVKPGKPTLVGRFDGTPVVGLPGNPTSALSVFRAFVAPVLREAGGRPPQPTAERSARLAVALPADTDREYLAPVGLIAGGDGAGNDAVGTTADLLAYPVDRGSGAVTSLAAADGVVTVAPDTAELPAGETVTVELFAPDVRPPPVTVAGAADPGVARLLDGVAGARYRQLGSEAGVAALRDGTADAAVLAGSSASPPPDATTLATWRREWGLVVRDGASVAALDGIAALLDDEHTLAIHRPGTGLRATLEAALRASVAGHDGSPDATVERATAGAVATRGLESPACRVARGDADVGVALRSTAERHGLDFVALGSESVRLLAAEGRSDRRGVRALAAAVERWDELVGDVAGIEGPVPVAGR